MSLKILAIRDAKKARVRAMRGVRYNASNTAFYYQLMRGLLEWMQEEFDRTVVRGLSTKEMTEKVSAFRDESPNERYRKMLAMFNKVLRAKYSIKVIEKLVRRALKRSSVYTQREFDRKAKSFGIDLSKSDLFKRYSSYMSTAVEENVMLVKNLRDEQAKRLQSIILRGMREGVPSTKLRGDIQHALQIGKKRATTIARTETHKLTQQVADARAMDLGFEEGVWRAVMDNRTSDQHARFNGKTFNLKKGLYDRKTRSYNWPGRRPNCRCWTEYKLTED